jgi:hypothetical protein
MALNSRGSIDPRWLYHNRGVIRALQLATVEIYNPASGSQAYDVATNAWTGSSTELFTGPARVQPMPASTEAAAAYNPTSFQMVRVQISYDANTITGGASMPDIRPNDRLRVTAAPYNTSLEKFIYVVTSVLNSSNNWERTLLCRVDIELDPTEV